MLRISVNKENAGNRIDIFISSEVKELSRNRVQGLVEDGFVKVNGETVKSKKIKVNEGDDISVEIPKPVSLNAAAENIPIDIVYEDDDVIVVNKPKGMVVHPAVGNTSGTLVNAVMYHCNDKLSSINGVIRPGIVHRIDKDTSGLIMIAKNDKAHESLAKQLEEHSVVREYRAVVLNNIKEESLKIEVPLGRDHKDRKKRAVYGLNQKRAVTNVEVLERFGRYTYIKAILETGRTHQIRVHLAYIKHPLVGDTVYGPKKQVIKTKGQLLHAKTLGFIHPSTGEYMEFDSKLPDEFGRVLNGLRGGVNGRE